ncbi:tail fiber assembly protein [Pseudomonas gozinkensis]|uniref:tail fiber assembly protein n=1 Tax=Pseudomonas gozinkensis TaxID=2774461 RepID=UPI00178806C9|nr:tail fiber assembly protein [Pseudomonas gozinkensis]
MNGYAITDIGWRSVKVGETLSEGEAFVEVIPQWLTEKSERDEMARQQSQQLAALMAIASQTIQPLQDDFEVGAITEEDSDRLRNWKIYRSALSKTPSRPGWPETPDWALPPNNTNSKNIISS